jgi:methanogenic corrinoid protein MtbC1
MRSGSTERSDGESNSVDDRAPFGIIFQPPLAVEYDDVEQRKIRLAKVVEDAVVPRLLAKNRKIITIPFDSQQHVGEVEVAKLSQLIIGPDNSDAHDYILALKDRGISLDLLHIELLEPTAQRLGELWEEDRIDFLDVTIGVSRLQRLVHVFAELDKIPPYDQKRRALIMTTPGEQHKLGNSMVQKFLRAGGWYVCSCIDSKLEDVANIVRQEWFAVVGFSLSSSTHLSSLAQAVRRVRNSSLNQAISVMVGGPAFVNCPERIEAVGADGTATNAPAAVVLAKKLLAESLKSGKV